MSFDVKKLCNSNYLKLIAIIAMTIDHGADLLYPGFPSEPAPLALHFIGRLTAPIMWFFYVYYPLHLVIIGIIRLKIYGDVNICL